MDVDDDVIMEMNLMGLDLNQEPTDQPRSLDVDIVAYGGSQPHISVLQHQSIHIHKMPQWPAFPRSLPKLLRPLFLILKPIFQFLVLLWYICVKTPAPDVFIVQNPPSVSTLVGLDIQRSSLIGIILDIR